MSLAHASGVIARSGELALKNWFGLRALGLAWVRGQYFAKIWVQQLTDGD